MQLSGENTREEYLEASRVVARRQGDWLRPLRWWGLAATAVGFLLLVGNVPHAVRIAPILLMATGLFSVIYPVWIAYSKLEEQWEKTEATWNTTQIEADDRGITFSTPRMHGTWRWDALAAVQETRSLFLLVTAEDEILASIPKRNLKGPDELGAFRRLVAEQLPERVKGFPVVIRGNADGE